jgi:purine-nucleoside phosphorylase
VFTIAARHGLEAGCVVVVSDLVATRERIGAEALEAAEREMGRVAAAALTTTSSPVACAPASAPARRP